MIEMPEAVTIARQMQQALTGKTYQHFSRGALTHKFLWLNRPAEEYDALLAGLTVTGATSYGRSIYLYAGDVHLLWFGELGGRIIYHPNAEALPAKYHLRWDFTDGSVMTFNMQMWGFVNLLERSELAAHPYAEVGTPPLSVRFNMECFDRLLEEYPEKTKKGVKGFLVTSKHINGIGNGYLQDILFRAKIHPTRKIPTLDADDRQRLHDAIQDILAEAIRLGGRVDERDLFDHPGGYKRLMSSETVGQPCPVCGTKIEKLAYLGGACYYCPNCQQ
ncbi:MAG TPA: DNA-formamidopyrimidine glycosylase family protein [Anaerolineales bacterium]|nr:DNA-formamidopyrimidine glycosylase family protein [Anaerolineales bacterium]